MKKVLKISGMLLAGVMAICLGVFATLQTLNMSVTSSVSFYTAKGIDVRVDGSISAYDLGKGIYDEVATLNVPNVAAYGTGTQTKSVAFSANPQFVVKTGETTATLKYSFTFGNLTDEAVQVSITAVTTNLSSRLAISLAGEAGLTKDFVLDGTTQSVTVNFDLVLSDVGTDLNASPVNFAVTMNHVPATQG